MSPPPVVERITSALQLQPMTVEQLATCLSLQQGTVRQHVRRMRNERRVRPIHVKLAARRPWVFYSLTVVQA